MDAEFDTLAAWTADVARELDSASRIPVGCRGSGGPGAMHWLLDHLRAEPDQLFLDNGAGVGGPAAFAAREAGVRPLLTDPQHGACLAARALFGLPALRAAGDGLPIAAGTVGVGWSLGVLCTVDDQPAFLGELRRVLHDQARFGLLVYCAAHPGGLQGQAPDGNTFPTVAGLADLLDRASLQVVSTGWIDEFTRFPADWEDATAAAQAQLARRHGDDPRWRRAQQQSHLMGALLDTGEVRGQLLVVQST